MADTTTLDPKTARRNERRGQILEAAMRLFADKGFHQTTMDDIVRASGVSKGGLYWHFKSKDDIIAALLERFFAQEMAGLDQLAEGGEPVEEGLLALADIVAEDIARMAEIQAIALEFYAVAARQEDVRAFLRDYFSGYRRALTTLLLAGFSEKGREADEKAAEELAVLLIAQFEGLALLSALDPDSFDLRRQCRLAVALVLDALINDLEA